MEPQVSELGHPRKGPLPLKLGPEDPDRDTDFESTREVLFRDHDVLLLFNTSLDGIEDTDSEVSGYYRFANLHPRRWFLPFADQPDE